MRIKVNLKSAGRRKQTVEPVAYEVKGHPSTVRELILAVTEEEVRTYNKKAESPELLACLTGEEIEDRALSGKVAFGAVYREKTAALLKAQDMAIQCFEDGIYRVFMDDTALEGLDDKIEITEESVFTFVKMTMLAGRLW